MHQAGKVSTMIGMVAVFQALAAGVRAEMAPPTQHSTQAAPQKEELVIFDFEGSLQDWTIPDWAMTSSDYVGKSLTPSPDFVSHGTGSLQLLVSFPGGKWTGGYLEQMMYVTAWVCKGCTRKIRATKRAKIFFSCAKGVCDNAGAANKTRMR